MRSGKRRKITVVSKDALQYVEEVRLHELRFDCICIDVFDEYNLVPDSFLQPTFLQRLSDAILTPTGILVWNFHSGGKKRGKIIQEISKSVSSVFNYSCWVTSIDSTPTGGNAILLASKDPIP